MTQNHFYYFEKYFGDSPSNGGIFIQKSPLTLPSYEAWRMATYSGNTANRSTVIRLRYSVFYLELRASFLSGQFCLVSNSISTY